MNPLTGFICSVNLRRGGALVYSYSRVGDVVGLRHGWSAWKRFKTAERPDGERPAELSRTQKGRDLREEIPPFSLAGCFGRAFPVSVEQVISNDVADAENFNDRRSEPTNHYAIA